MKPTIHFAALLALALATLALIPATASADDDAGDTADVEVIEFFWYGCPHCFRFQTEIDNWLADIPEHYDFKRVPALISAGWETHARAFYAAQVLGEHDNFHDAFFLAIHRDGRRLNSIDSIAEFAGERGIDAERFASTMESFAVESRLRRARKLNREYGLSGTPSMGVDGHLVSPRDAGSFAEMLRMVDDHAAAANRDAS